MQAQDVVQVKPPPPTGDPDALWVRQAQAGDQDAFEALVLAHQGFVYNLALRGLGDPAEAEDISQEAFLRAWTALPSFRGQARFRTWLYRIVVNLCYNRLPRLRRELAALPVEDPHPAQAAGSAFAAELAYAGQTPPVDPMQAVLAQERRAFLHRQIQHLPEGYRMMILLRFQQDLSYEEIAEVMALPLGTVKTGLFRARTQLRQALRQFEEAPV